MSIQMKNGCLVYYGSLIGYQAKDQAEVTVDPQFRREELESWLARRGLIPHWEEGVYERLANEGFHARDSAPELQSCRIWQLKPGTPIQMRFIGLDAMAQKFGGPAPEQYHVVYDGQIQDNDLEKLWNKFSRTPLGPDGQPLAISDVVELRPLRQLLLLCGPLWVPARRLHGPARTESGHEHDPVNSE